MACMSISDVYVCSYSSNLKQQRNYGADDAAMVIWEIAMTGSFVCIFIHVIVLYIGILILDQFASDSSHIRERLSECAMM